MGVACLCTHTAPCASVGAGRGGSYTRNAPQKPAFTFPEPSRRTNTLFPHLDGFRGGSLRILVCLEFLGVFFYCKCDVSFLHVHVLSEIEVDHRSTGSKQNKQGKKQ